MQKGKHGEGSDDFEDFPTPKDMRQWAEREIKDATKALELRRKEVAEIVRAYSVGEITPEKAHELQARYQHRWGEALPGATVGDGLSDERILADIDKAAGPFVTPREIHERYKRTFERKPGKHER
jgi:hypothetical protein